MVYSTLEIRILNFITTVLSVEKLIIVYFIFYFNLLFLIFHFKYVSSEALTHVYATDPFILFDVQYRYLRLSRL